MIQTTQSDWAYCQFEQLSRCRGVRHAVFLRAPGCSGPPFDRLNVSFEVGDDPHHVAGNRQRVSAALGAPELVFARQVHGANVVVVDGRPGPGATGQPPVADALITDRPGRFLAMQVADCQPILMCDPVRRVVANVHAGWRGSVANIAGQTLQVMQRRFGCDPQNVRVGIGPSLGPCCAEFLHYREEIPAALWGYRRRRVYFDFWSMSRDQLAAGGVPVEQIEVSGLCTRCQAERFFSHRREKPTGRFPAVIGLTADAEDRTGP